QPVSRPLPLDARDAARAGAAEDAARVFRAEVPEAVRRLVRRGGGRGHPDRLREADALVLALEGLAHGPAARPAPALSAHTPPALRVARERIVQEAAWSLDDTLGVAQPWPGELAAASVAVGVFLPPPASSAPTVPAMAPGQEAPQEARQGELIRSAGKPPRL